MMNIKWLFVRLLFALSTCTASAQTQPKIDLITGNESNNGSTLKQVVDALARTSEKHVAYSKQLNDLRNNVGLVFVPGILGSTLESPSAGQIWGFGIPKVGALELPPELIDPRTPSDVKAKIADSMFGIGLYNNAMAMIRDSASRAGIDPKHVIACGYDWRRDIRAGAADLQRCVENAPELANVKALIVVAHSMGGLVTWVWHQQNAPQGRLTNGIQILAVAVLGSPLNGSCEIVRMINSGYVQPTANQEYIRNTWLSSWWSEIKDMRDRFYNAISGAFSDPIRPVVLTWPGAIDLSPPPAASRYQTNCALVPFNPNDLGDSRILTHYMPDFWKQPIGVDLLNGATLPKTYSDVLAQAEKFRKEFKLKNLATPTYLYASLAWETPAQAPVSAEQHYRLASGSWIPVQGDGRVPFLSAVPEGVAPAEVQPIYSVHGNLPEDKIFHSKFFGDRLPRILNAWVATSMMAAVSKDSVFLKDYVADKGPFANPSDFYTAYEPNRGVAARFAISNEARSQANAFNESLCKAGANCPTSYARAKTLAVAGITNARRATLFSASLHNELLSDDDRTFAVAQRGLAMALERNWSGAVTDLQNAAEDLEKRRQLKRDNETDKEKQLRISVIANLGRALVIEGFCERAKEALLIGASGNNELAKKTLKAPCYDKESGKIVTFAR